MTGMFAAFGKDWTDFTDAVADFLSDMLRRTADQMADELDHAAMRDVEGAREWRDLQATGSRYADR